MMHKDATRQGEKLYRDGLGAIGGEEERRQANTRLDVDGYPSQSLNIKSHLSSPSAHPISQWPPPSQHTPLPSLSPHPIPLPPALSNVASPLQPPLPSARSLLSSFAMTPAYPHPPMNVVARSAVSQALHLQRKRLARSGPWKRHRCSSRAAIA
jgi:hypothetical protein